MVEGIAPWVGAHRAGILRVDIAAGLADLDLVDRDLERAGERRHQRLALLDQCSAARRAERGPSPGRRARSWIRRSISGPATLAAISAETKQSGRQAEPAGQRLHLFHRRGFRLARASLCAVTSRSSSTSRSSAFISEGSI
jgi:hypothetical protein